MTEHGELAGLVAEAFNVGQSLRGLRLGAPSSLETWRLETADGSFFIKRLWRTEAPAWLLELRAAMEFERLASEAGIAMPRPIPPTDSRLGLAVELPGHGVFRAYEWVDGRAVTSDDDLSDWLGSTLAQIHRLKPCPGAVQPDWYGLYPADQWTALFDTAAAQGKAWAALGHRTVPDIAALSNRILTVFRRAGDPVRTHSDIEPWNVLMTDHGPILVDWETGGIDSATLQAAQAAHAFGRARRTLAVYEDAGGRLADLGEDLLMRRAGLRLCRLHARIESALIADTNDQGIPDRLNGLSEFARDLNDRAIRPKHSRRLSPAITFKSVLTG